MKKYFVIVFLFISHFGFACCIQGNYASNYFFSDFVAVIKIKGLHRNMPNDNYYKVDIDIIENLKGISTKSLYVFGNIFDGENMSTEIYYSVGDTVLIFGNKNKDRIEIGPCTRSMKTTDNSQEYFNSILTLMQKFKLSSNVKYPSARVDYDFDYLDRISRMTLNKTDAIREYGVYQVNLNFNLDIESIDIIGGFGAKVDETILGLIQRIKFKHSEHTPIIRNTCVYIEYKKNNSDIPNQWTYSLQ